MNIYFEHKKKLYRWNCLRCIRNIGLLVIVIFFIFVFGYIGSTEYQDYKNSYKYQIETGKMQDAKENFIKFINN